MLSKVKEDEKGKKTTSNNLIVSVGKKKKCFLVSSNAIMDMRYVFYGTVRYL